MSEHEVLRALADALDAASAVLRQRAGLIEGDSGPSGTAGPTSPLQRARAMHPSLGPRQIEILKELEAAGSAGATTGAITRSIGYEQPNVYLTLKALMRHGLVTKDEAASPHRYRLSDLVVQQQEIDLDESEAEPDSDDGQ